MAHEDPRQAASTVLTVTVPQRLSLSAWHFTYFCWYLVYFGVLKHSTWVLCDSNLFSWSTIYFRIILPMLHISRGFPSCVSGHQNRGLWHLWPPGKNRTTGHQIWRISCRFPPRDSWNLTTWDVNMNKPRTHAGAKPQNAVVYPPCDKKANWTYKIIQYNSVSKINVSCPYAVLRNGFIQILSGN